MATELAGFEARKLVRAAASGMLATAVDGQPFGALVTPAVAPDFSLLLLLSGMSEHARQLKADARCALLVQGEAETINPQTAPRVSVTGLAELVPEAEVAALKACWLARHPYAAMYAGFGDFSLWRIRPASAMHVAGFARATRLRQADLLPDPAMVAGVAASAAGIVAHMNEDHADAMQAIAEGMLGAPRGLDWQMVGVDCDGCDIAAGELVKRLHWAAPVGDSSGVRVGLVQAAKAGRAALAGTSAAAA